MYKVLSIALITIMTSLATPSSAGTETDLEISSVELFYDDAITTPGKIIKRRLTRYSETPVWSKPTKIDAVVTVKNNSDADSSAVVITTSLYYLMSVDGDEIATFPSISTKNLKAVELKDLLGKRKAWVWNRVLGSDAIRNLKAHETQQLRFQNLDIESAEYPVDYLLEAFAVRVYVKSNINTETNYTNNVKNVVIEYPM